MNQGNHWPLGTRLMSPEEASEVLAKSARDLDAFSKSPAMAATTSPYARLTSDLRARRHEQTAKEAKPINWLGRP